MSALGTPLLLGSEGGYQISRSVRLRSSATAYFNRTFGTGSTTQWTWSAWFKRGAFVANSYIFSANNVNGEGVAFTSSNQILVARNGVGLLISNAVFRDPSAWYHVVVASDMGNATAALRCRVYVNGVEITSWATDARASYSSWGSLNSAVQHNLGITNANSAYFDGYLTEVNFIGGQALTPSSFGETDVLTGVWKPKRYAGTYGTNGFYLNFSDNSAATAAAIGKDSSGNGNNWTPNNISVTSGVTYDSMLDVPTMWVDGGNGRGNYAVWNPLSSNNYNTATDGNLRMDIPNARSCLSNISMSSGKWYCEVSMAKVSAIVGIAPATVSYTTAGGDSVFTGGGGWGYVSSGVKQSSGTTSSYGASWVANDIIGIAYDADTGSLEFFKNGTSQGVAFTGISVPVVFAAYGGTGTTAGTFAYLNAGQRPFAYTPPTGFKALNTQNLPDSTIKKGADYFDVTTYTGDGSSTRAVPLSIAPDLLWLKNRTAANDHILIDTVRGGTAPAKTLFSNLTNAEFTTTGAFNNYGYVDSLSGSTLNVVKGTQTSSYTNYLNSAYVGWQWKESASAGFDIVTFTSHASGSASFNHGLGVAPKMVIYKIRTTATDWFVYHDSIGATKNLRLNATSAESIQTAPFNNTAPTSTQFTLGTTFAGSLSMVAYLFAEVAGFSKFGSYTGNGSTDGPFVYCGFRPRWLMVKRTDSAGTGWAIYDTTRDEHNLTQKYLGPEASSAESTIAFADYLSNGFKVRSSLASLNASGGTYIYAAFAENPTKYSLAR